MSHGVGVHSRGPKESSIATSQTEAPCLSQVDHEHEDGDLLEKCQAEELAIIETAVSRLLRGEKFQLPVKTSDSTAAQVGGQEVQEGSRDKALLLGLLQEVRLLRSERKQRQAQISEWNETGQIQESARRFEKPEREVLPPQAEESLKVVVEAAAHAAVAAAEAAKAAALSVQENSAAIQTLVTSLDGGPSTPLSADGPQRLEVDGRSQPEGDKASTSQPLDDTKVVELTKVVRKQNKLTHWLLGFMVVTTALWRLKTLSVVMSLQQKMSNPIECIQSMFGGDKNEPSSPPKIPGFQEVATFLQGDPETGKPGLLSSLGRKEDEANGGTNDHGFSFGHLFPHHVAPEAAVP